MLGGCIHEYPRGTGYNPQNIDVEIEISYYLSWDWLLTNRDISTKADSHTHSFIIETLRDGRVIKRETMHLSSDLFMRGGFTQKVSIPLTPSLYEVAVWYEEIDEKSAFDTEDLNHISFIKTSTTENLKCAFAHDSFYLEDLYSEESTDLTRSIELQLAGARFQLYATDINEFIESQKAALNQGDEFTVSVIYSDATPISFDLYAERPLYEEGIDFKLKGELWMPYDSYEELKIAEGFTFCKAIEDTINISIVVYNSAMMVVSKIDEFTIPVKRGYITIVRGDFLTHPLDGIFSIDHIWEDEFVIEV